MSQHPPLHPHCESCYSRRCRAPPERTVSCAVAPCPLLCGAVFHLCKQEDHSLLCPNQRLPCLNATYGCPHTMSRAALAAHLRRCPASVVCCSMEWNRWPVEDAQAHRCVELHANLLRAHKEACTLQERDQNLDQELDLDLAMALRDQNHLFHSLKMKTLFPELCGGRPDEPEEEEEEEKEEVVEKEEKIQKKPDVEEGRSEADCGNVWDHLSWRSAVLPEHSKRETEEKQEQVEEEEEEEQEEEPSQEEREALARASGLNTEGLQSYNGWERSMFSMEMGGCRVAGEGGAPEAATANPGRGVVRGAGLSALMEEDHQKDRFVYGSVEPMRIVNVRTFKVPTSFQARMGRIRNPGFYRKENRAVDTGDLGVGPEDIPVWEEVQASLLCALEKEQRGHQIAEGMFTDTLVRERGTQTYNFLTAPFRRAACLADLTVVRAPELHLQLHTESVTSRHHKASSAFTFLCGHSFPRREYGKHFRNVHSDIQTCVSGWFEQRCPLAYLGCTFSQRRFQPSTHKATVTYDQNLSCFSLRPTLPGCLAEEPQPHGAPGGSREARGLSQGARQRVGPDSLSLLPYEVLCHVAGFLDSLSLSRLALVSLLLRDVCSSLLRDRGMVTLRWQKKTYSDGGTKWRVGQEVWEFSTMFSPVGEWCFRDEPPMSEHLKACSFYQRDHRDQRIHLPCVVDDFQTHTPQKSTTLVTAFKERTIT